MQARIGGSCLVRRRRRRQVADLQGFRLWKKDPLSWGYPVSVCRKRPSAMAETLCGHFWGIDPILSDARRHAVSIPSIDAGLRT